MIRLRSIVFVLLILILTVASCAAADSPKYGVGSVIAHGHGPAVPQYDLYAVMDAEHQENPDDTWIYTLLRIYEYPSGGTWYALIGEQPSEGHEEFGMGMDGGYSYRSTGRTLNINSIPREPSILQLPAPKYQRYDIVQVNGHYEGPDLVHSGGNSGTYAIVNSYEASNEGDQGVYFTSEIRKKADGSWGYVLSRTLTTSFWDEKREFEANVNQFVTHLSDDSGVEYVDEFPIVAPVTTIRTPVTTLIPIKIDTPTLPITLPPTPIRTEGPSSNPFYPVNTQPTVQPAVPLPTVIQPTIPVPVAPIAPLPTAQPTFRFGKRYAVGDPGSFLGTKYGGGTTTTVTKRSRTVTGSDAVLKPGSRSYGITPPASGSFVRWYPAARWAAGIK